MPKSNLNSRGQSLVETALMLPLLIMIVLNVVNLSYFFLVIVNLTGASRTSAEFAIMGSSTPYASALPSPGPANGTPAGNLTVAYVTQQDMTGALANPTATTTSIQICSQALGLNASGQAKCQTCSGTTCQGAVNAGSPAQGTDPETNFILNEVDITYQFNPLIPGKIFNIPLQAFSGNTLCNSSGCTFTRRAMMRAMN